MSIFNEYFFPTKTFKHRIPLRCTNNTEIEGKLIAFHNKYKHVIKLTLIGITNYFDFTIK